MRAVSQNRSTGAASIMWLSMGAMEHSPWILQSLRLLGISSYITNGLFVNYR